MAERTYKAKIYLTSSSSVKDYNFSFDYINKTYIKVKIGVGTEPLKYGSDYTVVDHTVRLVNNPPNEQLLEIYRETPTDRTVEWYDSSILRAKDLNLYNIQMLHINEENIDKLLDSGIQEDKLDNKWDGRLKVLKNLADPVEDQDAVTKSYLSKTKDSFIQQSQDKVNKATRQADIATSKATIATSQAAISTSQATKATNEADRAKREADRSTTQANAAAATKTAIDEIKADIDATHNHIHEVDVKHTDEVLSTVKSIQTEINGIASDTATYRDEAATSASNAKYSANLADASVDLAAQKAEEAKYYASIAEDNAGGDFITKTEGSSLVKSITTQGPNINVTSFDGKTSKVSIDNVNSVSIPSIRDLNIAPNGTYSFSVAYTNDYSTNVQPNRWWSTIISCRGNKSISQLAIPLTSTSARRAAVRGYADLGDTFVINEPWRELAYTDEVPLLKDNGGNTTKITVDRFEGIADKAVVTSTMEPYIDGGYFANKSIGDLKSFLKSTISKNKDKLYYYVRLHDIAWNDLKQQWGNDSTIIKPGATSILCFIINTLYGTYAYLEFITYGAEKLCTVLSNNIWQEMQVLVTGSPDGSIKTITQNLTDNSTNVATTAFVQNNLKPIKDNLKPIKDNVSSLSTTVASLSPTTLERNKKYTVGDIVYSNELPPGYYLRCTKAGTTGSTYPTFPSNLSNGVLTDGTCVFEIKELDRLTITGIEGKTDLHSALHRYGDNPTDLKGLTNEQWHDKGTFISYFSKDNLIENQPSTYGQLINLVPSKDPSLSNINKETLQLFLKQADGDIYVRGGNGVINIKDEKFKRCVMLKDKSGNTRTGWRLYSDGYFEYWTLVQTPTQITYPFPVDAWEGSIQVTAINNYGSKFPKILNRSETGFRLEHVDDSKVYFFVNVRGYVK